MDKIKIYNILKYLSYILVFIGVYYGILEIEKNKNIEKGVNNFVKIGIIPLLFFAFIWHTFLNGTIIKNSNSFFEIECGGANLGICLALILGYLLNINTKSICCILTVFLIYMIIALYCHVKYFKKIYSKLKSIPLIIILIYFIIKGII